MRNAKHPDRLRAVLDTNVLVSAFQFPKGSIAGAWWALKEGRYVLVTSPTILSKLAEILRRRFGWNDNDRKALLKLVSRNAEIFQPKEIPEAVPNDPDDNHIVACAREGHADLIVSGDRHLLDLGEYEGIPIIRPADFLRTVGRP
ncbi:putative toxin-antitoxin system toxin component, PIN family [Methylomagnum ishizawai]|uniref:putative toxin-antitoxin system toxin component, PIN family n=1 Tax=Methylomagnum ishizawai TaxID=1760988 RepID=UPI001C326E42|nr:putative toxin-antitoxin system toxin component, PIN family [Methylomagnum ishizawai]BBL77483.1 putative toxin-antitoxin system toxin component, PIN family protein [Methylomagnum ishizawai]